MGEPVRKIQQKYTYDDYKNWPDDERWEIIDGVAYNMSPAPKVKHQLISRNISGEIYKQKDKLKGCSFFEAPTDVVFDDYNVVQPDIFIVCDKNKLTEDNIQGAPDLIIEILSNSTAVKDRREKFKLYERFGVKEYIIVHPDGEYVERYLLQDGRYQSPEIFGWDEEFKFKTFEIEFNLWEIFEKEKEEGKDKKSPQQA